MAWLKLVFIFARTAYYGTCLIGKKTTERNQIKKKWARMVLTSLGYTLSVRGKTPEDQSLILVGNHISFLDIAVIMADLPDVIFIAKQDVKNWPILGPSAAAAGTIFVDREKRGPNKQVRNQILDALLKKDKKIVVFPSGTTSLDEKKPWKKGIFKMAQQSESCIQLFHLTYTPLRESAYIDDDNLLKQITALFKIKEKKILLTWVERFEKVSHPELFAEELRQKVINLMTTRIHSPPSAKNKME